MTWWARAAALLVVLAAVLPAGRPVCADEAALARAKARYLATRDAAALLQALRAAPGEVAPEVLAIAAWAAGETPGTDGRIALVEAVAAMRRGDVSPARRLVARAESETPGAKATWLGALVRMRAGDDAGAQGRLMAPPLFHWEDDAFDLALLGAALPLGDLDVLLSLGERTLRRASARARTPALVSTALALVAFDRERGPASVALAMRALRRAGALEEAIALRDAALAAGVPATHPALVEETFLAAWLEGADDLAPLRAAAARAGDGRAARLGPPPRRVPVPGAVPHREGEAVADFLVARLLVALGQGSDEADARAWRVQRAGRVNHADFARRFLADQGLRAVTVAGDDALALRMLAAGYPFLLYRIVRTGDAYHERPVLVRAYDAASGMWVVDEPHLGRPDLVPRGVATKARLVLAAPMERGEGLAGAETTPAGRAGTTIEGALVALHAGDGDAAASALRAAERPGARAVLKVYRAFLHYQHALATGEGESLLPAIALLQDRREPGPVLGFEAFAFGQATFIAGERDPALAAFAEVQEVEGPSAALSLARFAVYRVERREAASIEALDRALYHDPLDTRALFFRGSLRARRGDVAGARNDLRRALDREPTAEPFAVALVDIELDNGRPAAALDVLRTLIRHEPAHATSRQVRDLWQKAELGLMQRADTVDALRPFRRSPEPDTRRALAYRLAGLENPEAEGLLRLLLEDPEPSVRITVIRLYMRAWLRSRLHEDVVLLRTVTGLLRESETAGVRTSAAQLLGRVPERVAAQALAGTLVGEARDTDPTVRHAAARALAGQDPRRATDALIEALLDEVPEVRAGAIDSLFRLTGRRGGYDPEADLASRRAAVDAWRAWAADQRGPRAPETDAGGPDR